MRVPWEISLEKLVIFNFNVICFTSKPIHANRSPNSQVCMETKSITSMKATFEGWKVWGFADFDGSDFEPEDFFVILTAQIY